MSHQKGATALVLTILILSVLLMIALGISGLMVSQLKMSRETGESVPAYFAADAGAELALFRMRKQDIDSGSESDTLSNGASFSVEWDKNLVFIKSTGTFKQTKRKVEINW